jgi:chorismate synthase
MSPEGIPVKLTNHSGGILGGISDGSPIILRAAIKPTPSISQEQSTITKDGQSVKVQVKGRHDPIIVPRAVVVVESMVALTLLDMMLSSINSRMDNLIRFFR